MEVRPRVREGRKEGETERDKEGRVGKMEVREREGGGAGEGRREG